MKNKFNATFWSDNYNTNKTGWDIGHVSTPIQNYIEQLKDKTISILIPGCGNGYEAEFLHKLGFENVDILDIVQQPLTNFSKRVPSYPEENLIHADFFSLEKQYDLIIEQTFFCALDPELRTAYATKMQQLLKPNGKLVGLLFNFPLTEEGPPFGGCKEEYLNTFSTLFHIRILEASYNSIKPRQGKELFIIFENNN